MSLSIPLRMLFRHYLLPALFPFLLFVAADAQELTALESARQAMESKQYSTAEQFYRKALRETPLSPAVLTGLGLSLQLQGRSADAMHYYSLALKQQYSPETYALLAEETCHMGDLERLRPMLARIYREQRRNIRVISAVAPCYMDIDEPIESTDVYEELLKSNDYPADLALVQQAKSYLRSGQYFVGKLNKTPGSAPFLAALRQASGDGSAGARSAFPEASRISPYFKPDLTWAEAVQLWRQHPQDTGLLYLLSVLSGEQAMRQIETCDQRYSASPYLEQFHADVLADQGHSEEAIAEYEELMRKHPELSDLPYRLGLLEQKRGEWEKAAQAFRQQLTQNPKDERAAAHLSNCMLQMGQYAELQTFLHTQMHGEHPPEWARLDLAEAEQKLGNTEAAIQVLVTAEHQPNADKLVHYRLMRLYSSAGRTDDAKREYALFQGGSH